MTVRTPARMGIMFEPRGASLEVCGEEVEVAPFLGIRGSWLLIEDMMIPCWWMDQVVDVNCLLSDQDLRRGRWNARAIE